MTTAVWKNKFFDRRTFVILGILFALFFVFYLSGTAHASGSDDLPWNTGLKKLVNAFSGRTAILICCIGLVAVAGMAMFGGDLGVMGKSLMILVFAGSILGGLVAISEYFVTSSGCLLLL